MNKMILYKEWLKTRWTVLGAAVVFAAVSFYCLLNLMKIVEIRSGAILWEAMVEKDAILLNVFRFLPALAGLLLALSQFVPEVLHKRFKLTLHLPYPQNRMVLIMLGYGLVLLTVLFAVQAGVSALVLRGPLVKELVWRIIVSLLPWYLAGWAAYIFTSALCLEPAWKKRVPILLVAAGLLYLMFISDTPEAYSLFLPWLLGYTLLSIVLVFYAVIRFKEGAQD